MNDYNILANYIVGKYIDRISGNHIVDRIIGDEPSKKVMVGMLAEDRIEKKLSGQYKENEATKFESVPSISLSFFIDKNSKGSINILPQGILFYSVKPTFEEVKEYVINLYSEKDGKKYLSIEDLCETYPEQKFEIPSAYKKIDIAKSIGNGIKIAVEEIKEGSYNYEQELTEKLQLITSKVMEDLMIIPALSISFFDLLDNDKFNRVCKEKDQKVHPKWKIDVISNVKVIENSMNFNIQIVNRTPVNGKEKIGYSPRIFNAGLTVVGSDDIVFQEIKLDYFTKNYKKYPSVYAIAENATVRFLQEKNMLMTENIPIYYQYRLKTNDQYSEFIKFNNLISDPVKHLNKILNEMKKDYLKRKEEFEANFNLSETARKKFGKDLYNYEAEIGRFELGIKQIEYKDIVKRAFVYMNKTFQIKIDGEHRQISGWRLFQIVYIVSLISEMISSEYKHDYTLQGTEINLANLLYFPTGGGKTEAFLAACVFDMFFDRLRGKNEGVSAYLKYPLRLLAVQQLERVLVVVMKANKVKSEISDLKQTKDFAVGFYVGSSNTPNRISGQEPLSSRGENKKNRGLITESDQSTLNEYYRFIDTCPMCGEKMINIKFDVSKWKLEHVCCNPSCSTNVLPLFIVDNEIYRYLPSIIVSTIDKMAMIGITNEFKMLFGQVKKYCPVHGFSCTSTCMSEGGSCEEELVEIGMLKDPVPTLFIQDEMHLVKESLGTFDSHYESFLQYYTSSLLPDEHKKNIRFIGATATISMYKEHIRNLYHMEGRRFPCEYPSVETGKDFYSYTDKNDITRILLAYAPYGRSNTNGVWESVYIMRLVIYYLLSHIDETYNELIKVGFNKTMEDYKNMLYEYWIELVYNNTKNDATELQNSFQNQGNNALEKQGIPLFNIEQMTSDTDFQSVRKTLFDIQNNRENLESTNLILATSTISHGVDEDSFNIMYFYGMPNSNAEYIQAYSRTGRKYTGIVIDIIRLMRERDRSYLKNFVIFHQNKDYLVESVPLNTWARNAIYSTLPGILSGLVLQYYSVINNQEKLYNANKLKSLLKENKIQIEDVIEKIMNAYGCNKTVKLSEAYIDIIIRETTNILNGIKHSNFDSREMISNAIAKFSHSRNKPMTSLRDSEEQITIEK